MISADHMEDIRDLKSIAVVIPIYNEAPTIPKLWDRLTSVLSSLEVEAEIIAVNDGSTDGSFDILGTLSRPENIALTIVDLSRNFGHPQAVSAGLNYADKDATIVMDGDLQDIPEAIPEFIAQWRKGFDVVYALREKRKENLLKRLAFFVFYRIQKRLVNINIPVDAGLFSLMDTKVIKVIQNFSERNRYIPGLRAFAGFKQIGIKVERGARDAGKPKVSIWRLINLSLDAIFSYSLIPIRLTTGLGLVITVSSILVAIFALAYRLSTGNPLLGWQFGLSTIFFMFGAVLFILGVIGEYIGRIYEEVKARPYYIVKAVYRKI